MLELLQFGLLALEISLPLIIVKDILIHKKDDNDDKKVLFFILLLLSYIIESIILKIALSTSVLGINYINEILKGIIFIGWMFYYRKFYDAKYVQYIVVFYVVSLYYHTIKNDILERHIFFLVTGNVISSEGALLATSVQLFMVKVYSVLIILFGYVLCKLIYNKVQILKDNNKNYIYLSIVLMANALNISLSLVLRTLERHGWTYSEMYVFTHEVTPHLTLANSIVLILLFIQIIKENKLKTQQKLMDSKLDMQYKHYLSVQESHMKVRKLYHDINNHICCIDKLKSNNGEIDEYVKNLKDEIKGFNGIYNTGNAILDIILTEKDKVCIDKDIKFDCDINMNKIDFMKPIDVSSIFSNILDNAIEACEKIENKSANRYIRIKGTIIKSYFVLKCENSKINKLNKQKNKLITDKKDKFMHGIGMQSIKSSVEKYSGELLFEEREKEFMVAIYIPLKQNTDSWVD